MQGRRFRTYGFEVDAFLTPSFDFFLPLPLLVLGIRASFAFSLAKKVSKPLATWPQMRSMFAFSRSCAVCFFSHKVKYRTTYRLGRRLATLRGLHGSYRGSRCRRPLSFRYSATGASVLHLARLCVQEFVKFPATVSHADAAQSRRRARDFRQRSSLNRLHLPHQTCGRRKCR